MQCAPDSCTIHLLKGKDADELAALEAACFSTGWSAEKYKPLLDAPPGSPSCTLSPSPVFGLRTPDGRLAGYVALGVHAAAEEAEIYNIAVAENLRQKGYGSLLLNHVVAALAGQGISRIFLEVRTGNAPALALYAAAGFSVCGRRKQYYADTGEDALVLCRDGVLPPGV